MTDEAYELLEEILSAPVTPPIIWVSNDTTCSDGTFVKRGTYFLRDDGGYDYTPEIVEI